MAILAGVLAAAATAALYAGMELRVDGHVLALATPATAGAASRIPTFVHRVARLPIVGRLAGGARLQARLSAAGWHVRIEDVLVAKLLCAFGGCLAVLLAGPTTLLLAPAVAAGAFVVPDLLMARAARGRRRRVETQTVQFLDLLAAASSAGLSAPAAIARAGAGMRGPLAEELAGAAAAVEVGARWRDELRAIAGRYGLPDLQAAVTVIARTESLGSSLAEALRDLADEVREARRARSAEQARTAPVKMLFPLVFMILPAFLLLTVVPVLIATLRSLH